MQAADGKYEFEGDVIVSTVKAVLFHGDWWDREDQAEGVWLSRKFCEFDFEPGGQRCTVLVPAWLAKKAGIADDD